MSKRFLRALTLVVPFFNTAKAFAATEPQIIGASAITMDMDTGEIIYSKNADVQRSPASPTKLLTSLLFAENKPESDKLALSKLDPLIKKGNYPAIHAKALYDISAGFKAKNEKPIQQGLNSIQELAKKGYVPALMAVGNMFVNGNIIPQNLPEAKKIFSALAKENIPQAKESLATVDKMIAEQAKAPKANAKKS